MSRTVIQGFIAPNHDHDLCVDDALRRAEEICATRGERLTPLRRRVLELVWNNHLPVKAYDLLEMLSDASKRAAPPTVYRALDFLLEAGLIHRVESLNAYIGCAQPDREHGGQFLICQSCGATAELDDADLSARIAASAKRLGFEVQQEKVEVTGICTECRAGRLAAH